MKALAVMVILLGATASGAADWPQWRGPGRDAVSPATGLVDHFPESGPRVLWRAAIGAGYSGVSVSGDRLFTSWDEGGKQYLVCLDAGGGKELWRRELGAAFSHPYGDGPRSTPLVEEGVVVMVGTQGRVLAVDAVSGETRWQRDLVEELAAKLPSYGYASSPLAVDGAIVLEVGGENAAFVAFDRGTGETLWATGNDGSAYSSPIEVAIGGVRQIVFWSGQGLRSVSPEDGRLLWRYDHEMLCPVSGEPLNTGTPILVAPDRIFLASGAGAALIQPVRRGESFEVRTIWESRWMRSDVNTAVLVGDHVYGFDGSFLECLDVGTGKVRWRARGFGKGSLIAADGRLIVLGESGNLGLVRATPEGFVLEARADVLHGKSWTTPSLAGGRLFLRNHEELVCLDLARR